MVNYIVKRILLAFVTIAVISLASFLILSLPEGDFVDEYVQKLKAEGDHVSLARAQDIREYYRLDEPIVAQYWRWISNLVQMDFGYGFAGQQPIEQIIGERLPATIALTAVTIVLIWIVAFPIGIYSAVRQHTIGDYTFTFLGFTGLAVPDFLLGLLLMYVAFRYFDQSVGGLYSTEFQGAAWTWGKFMDLLGHVWIPALVLGTAGTAGLIRTMRNNLLDELAKPYVVTARAKGLRGWKVIAKYPVRVALNPFISGVGTVLPALVGGSVIVSVVVGLPTLNPVLLDATLQQDMHLAGTILLMLGILTVVGVLISDLFLVLVDPRIRFSGGRGSGY